MGYWRKVQGRFLPETNSVVWNNILIKTWHREDSADKMLHPLGYLFENVYRKNKKRKGRASGKIIAYYKKELKNILTFLQKSSENHGL